MSSHEMSLQARVPSDEVASSLGSEETSRGTHVEAWCCDPLSAAIAEKKRVSVGGSPRRTTPAYASERWAQAVVRAAVAADDTRTLMMWGRLVGASRGTLMLWCRAAQAPPKASLDLGRLLRVLVVTDGHLDDLQELLNITDPRTVERLMQRSGLNRFPRRVEALPDFLKVQRLITNPRALNALTCLLERTVPPFSRL
jgi:hypothetical protein